MEWRQKSNLGIGDLLFSHDCYHSPNFYQGLSEAFPEQAKELEGEFPCYNPYIDAYFIPTKPKGISDLFWEIAIRFEDAHRMAANWSPFKCYIRYLTGFLHTFVWWLAIRQSEKSLTWLLSALDNSFLKEERNLGVKQQETNFFSSISIIEEMRKMYFSSTKLVDEVFSLLVTIEGLRRDKPFLPFSLNELEKSQVHHYENSKDEDFHGFYEIYYRTKKAIDRIGFTNSLFMFEIVYTILPHIATLPTIEAVIEGEIKSLLGDATGKTLIKETPKTRLIKILDAIEKEIILFGGMTSAEVTKWLTKTVCVPDRNPYYCYDQCLISELESYLKYYERLSYPGDLFPCGDKLVSRAYLPVVPLKYTMEILKHCCNLVREKHGLESSTRYTTKEVVLMFDEASGKDDITRSLNGFFADDYHICLLIFLESMRQQIFMKRGLVCPLKVCIKDYCNLSLETKKNCLYRISLKNIWNNTQAFDIKVWEMPECLR